MIDLRDKVAIVTGGSRGIGAAVAKALAGSGAKVAITFQSKKALAAACVRRIVEDGGECLAVKAEATSVRDVKRVVDKVQARFGRIDILVNNAGVWKRGEIGNMSERQWDETLAINLKGTFLFCNEIVPIMKRQKAGKIINIASTAGQRGEPFYSHYAASKGGVIAFAKSIAAELAPFNINVNTVSPGWVETDMTEQALGNRKTRPGIDALIPRGKVAQPEDITGAVLFLASDAASHIVGATINVNGGSVLF